MALKSLFSFLWVIFAFNIVSKLYLFFFYYYYPLSSLLFPSPKITALLSMSSFLLNPSTLLPHLERSEFRLLQGTGHFGPGPKTPHFPSHPLKNLHFSSFPVLVPPGFIFLLAAIRNWICLFCYSFSQALHTLLVWLSVISSALLSAWHIVEGHLNT